MRAACRNVFDRARNVVRRPARATLLVVGCAAFAIARIVAAKEAVSPEPWPDGSDHVGIETPLYATGEECLFCHRSDVGPSLPRDAHTQTIRYAGKGQAAAKELEVLRDSPALAAFADEVAYVMGGKKAPRRFLRDAPGHNRLAISDVRVGRVAHVADSKAPSAASSEDPDDAPVFPGDSPAWDEDHFARSCVGCHCTAVEEEEGRPYGAIALDCYSCHGDVSLEHANDTKEILLSRKREDPPLQIAAICGSCHLRGGRSRSTGAPYPNQFVPGDDLFRDYEVDFSDENLARMNPGERHIFQNVRDITMRGERRTTCLTCHEIHYDSPALHLGAPTGEICWTCHPKEDRSRVLPYERSSPTCEY